MNGSMLWSRGVAACLSGISLVLALPAKADDLPSAASVNASPSEQLRRLDIMLMVTGLRCRNTADDFQADFQAFEARHLPELNAAAREMAQQYAAQMGADEADRMVDRLSVQMANHYGNGHPWLGCHELKGLAQALAGQDGRDVLLQAASGTLDGDERLPAVAAPVSIAAR